MAADTTTLTEKMRAALRISSTSEKITEEINDCIAACKADMKNDGVKVIKRDRRVDYQSNYTVLQGRVWF